MIETKALVIGSGPSGCVTTLELLKKNIPTILIERGIKSKSNEYSVDEMEKKYKHGGVNLAFGKNKIAFVEGQTLGGGSEINSGLYHRLPQEIYKEWKEYDLSKFSDSEMEEHFLDIEKKLNIQKAPEKFITKASKKLEEGATKMGWVCNEVPRWIVYSEEKYIKQSMSETYIKNIENMNGKIFTNTEVKYFKKNNNFIVHCNDLENNQKVLIKTKYLFICSGAIETPSLLRKSGYKHNIGNSLYVHPTAKIVARFDQKINSKNAGVGVHQVKEFAPKFSFGCSISSKEYLSINLINNMDFIDNIETEWEKMYTYYSMIKPEGKGIIRNILFSKHPFISYSLTKNDSELIRKSLIELSKLLFAADAKELYIVGSKNFTLKEKNFVQKINEIKISDLDLMTIHLFSSCPIGENKKLCAANSFGKVYGESNLYINDSSMLPTAPSVNPQGTIMAMARRNVLNFIKYEYEK